MGVNEKPFPENWREWTVIGELNQSGRGAVYQVKRELEGREEYGIIKVIDIPGDDNRFVREDEHACFQDIKDAFVNKVQAVSEQNDSTVNLVRIEDYLVEEKFGFGWRIYLRMEYLRSLSSIMQDHEMSEQDVIQLALGICNALACLHEQNIYHQDIKPANIFYSSKENCFKLGDFGATEEAGDKNAYAAPEVWRGETYEASADLYALGLILYQLMNKNVLPFEELSSEPESNAGPIEKRVSGRGFKRPGEASEEFADVIMKACAFVPQLRYQSAEKMRDDLLKIQQAQRGTVLADTEVESPSPESVDVTTKKSGRGGRIFLIIIGALILFGCSIFAGFKISDALREPNGIKRAETETEKRTQKETETEKTTTPADVEENNSSGTQNAAAIQYEATATVYVRDEANADSEELGYLSEGDVVTSTGATSGNWMQIYYTADGSDPSATGWVSLNYFREVETDQKEADAADAVSEPAAGSSSAENTAVYEQYRDFIDQQISDFYDDSGMFTIRLSVGEEYKRDISWSDLICYSSDESVVTVTSGGKVTAVGTGTAYVVIISALSAQTSAMLGSSPMAYTFEYIVS